MYLYMKKNLLSIFIQLMSKRPFFIMLLFVFTNSIYAQTLVTSVEAENGTRSGGLTIGTANAGYSGTGYVTNMANTGDNLTIPVTVPTAGNYKLVIRYNGPYGDKSQDIYVNGVFVSTLIFPATTGYSDLIAGSLTLTAGANTIGIYKNWGYTDYDKITLYTVPPHDYTTVVTTPIDGAATPEVMALYNYLRSGYGSTIISGQTSDYYNTVSPNPAKKPVIRAFDFQHYTVGYAYLWNNTTNSQGFGWEDDGTVQTAIDWYNSTCQKGMVSFHWHWHSPFGGQAGTNTFNTNLTTFDVTKAVTPGTAENTAILRDIDSIATQLKRLQAAGVPVLWRPLHEAGGGWFWWGAKGSAAALSLYDILYNRLTTYHNIHNLIWEWSTPEPSWYPGNAKVDLLGYDSYPGAYNYGTQKLMFDQLFTIVNGQKLVALTENGPIPDPDMCFASDAKWAYFMSWSDLVTSQNSAAQLSLVYNHAKVTTLDEVTTATNVARLSAAGSTTFCTGGSVVLNANTAKGYTYKWYNGSTQIAGATASSYTATAAGSYTVAVTATGSCTTTSSPVIVSIGGPAATITPASGTTFCSGGSVALNANTGTGLTYQWNVSGNAISGATTSSYTASTTGLYTVKVTSSGCSITSAGTQVTANASPTATITAGGNTTFCQGGSVALNANTGTGLTYQWNAGGNAISGATTSSYTASTTGLYSVKVTSSGCSTTSAGTQVTANALPTATITAGGNTSFCAGGSVALNANTGTGLTYQWNAGGNAISGATTSSYTASTTGLYTVKVTSSGCSTTSAGTQVTANALPTATITAGGNTSFCAGGSVALNANTGTGLTYQWNAGGNAISGATTSSYTASTTGLYTVKVSSSGCSTTSAGTQVTANASPTATITAGGNTTFCQGSSVALNANTGTGLTYQWNAGGNAISGATTSSYTASTTGLYTVKVTSSGCSTTSAGTQVTANASPTATITAGGNTTFCSGSSVALNANTGTGLTYQWSNAAGFISGATNATYSAAVSDSYRVTVANATNCSATSTASTVTVNALPTATITAGGNTTFCQGGSVLLTSSSGSSYKWSNASGVIVGATNASYTAIAAGNYTVEVTNANSCKAVSAATQVSVTTSVVWYADADGDGKGDPNNTLAACTQPVDYVAEAGDTCPTDPNKIAAGNCGCNKTETSCLDCMGVPNGTAAVDVCGVCAGGTSGITPKTNLAQCTTTATQTALSSALKIYPNPSSGSFTIQVGGGSFTATIYNSSGQKISTSEYESEAIIGSELPEGVYMLHIEQDRSVVLRKIIKQ